MNWILGFILLMFMFYGSPDVFDILREYIMEALRSRE